MSVNALVHLTPQSLSIAASDFQHLSAVGESYEAGAATLQRILNH
jgi:hypothetical protein